MYYKPVETPQEDIQVMKLIDGIHLAHPFKGSRKITRDLLIEHQLVVNRKKVLRLMNLMGIIPLYPKRKTMHIPVMVNTDSGFIVNT